MLQSTRLRAARSLAARNRAFFTCARNAIGSGPLAGADPCAPARSASAATANAAMASSNIRIFDIVWICKAFAVIVRSFLLPSLTSALRSEKQLLPPRNRDIASVRPPRAVSRLIAVNDNHHTRLDRVLVDSPPEEAVGRSRFDHPGLDGA